MVSNQADLYSEHNDANSVAISEILMMLDNFLSIRTTFDELYCILKSFSVIKAIHHVNMILVYLYGPVNLAQFNIAIPNCVLSSSTPMTVELIFAA